MTESADWTVSSWERFPVKQQPTYNNKYDDVQIQLQKMSIESPLVSIHEIDHLNDQLTCAVVVPSSSLMVSNRFILHAGDCAELFKECSNYEKVDRDVNLLNYLSQLIEKELTTEVIVIARMAGQFAKPRSSETEEITPAASQTTVATQLPSVTVPAYRGDLINSTDPQRRHHCQDRMITAYQHAK